MSKLVRPPRISGLVEVVAWLATVCFLLGFLGKIWWGFDLCSHFRVQYAATLFLCAVILALMKRRKQALLFIIPATGITLLLLARLFESAPAETQGTARFKIVSFNVNTANSRHREVLDYLLRENADVIFLMEVNEQWLADLRELELRYPFHLKSPRDDNFGLAVYSRPPLSGEGVVEFGPAEVPVLDCRLEMFGDHFRLIGIHTLPPVGNLQSRLRNEQLLHFANAAALSDAPTILIGDFNLTPFSPWFTEILQRSALRDSAAGFVWSPTWMRSFPFVALRIDQALIPGGVAVAERKIGSILRLGSQRAGAHAGQRKPAPLSAYRSKDSREISGK